MLRYLQTIRMQLPHFLEVRMARMQVLNTKGAAKRLGCSQTWIHRLVSTGKLKAFIYDDNGRLVERKPQEKRQGQALSFRVEDIDAYRPAVQRRPRGSKNKQPRVHEQQVPPA